MSKIDIRLLYQKDSGLSLDGINQMESLNRHDIQPYIDWLEETLETALSVGEQLLDMNTLLLANEEIYQKKKRS